MHISAISVNRDAIVIRVAALQQEPVSFWQHEKEQRHSAATRLQPIPCIKAQRKLRM